jgi:hypothetical protein
MAENALERAALEYIGRGWSVIPLRFTGSVEDRKKPLLPTWLEYQQRIPTDAEVKAWWKKWPAANVAIPTGKVSDLVILDMDGPNCSELFRQQKIHLPKTAAVQTGKGYHVYYRHPGNSQTIANRVALLRDGAGSQVDIRGDGGFVVAPPSVHGNGRVYQWAIPPTEAIAPLPDEVVALFVREQDESGRVTGKDWVSEVIDGVADGQRNDTAASLAGYFLCLTKCHEESAYFALRAWNALNKPPLSDKELRNVVTSIAARERRKLEQEARNSPGYTRIEVLDGPAWADALKNTEPRNGIPAPIPTLEEVGGLVAGDVVVLAGPPGMGKTTMACRVIADVCIRRKTPTIFFSTEMTRSDVGRWVAANLQGCAVNELPRNIPEIILAELRASPIKIIDAGTVRVEDIETITRSAIGTRLIIIDHLTRLATSRRETRTLEVGEVARRLKGLAKDSQLTVLELCQLNREGNDGTQPSLKSLRDSGEIEQEADAVIFNWTSQKDLLGRNLRLAIFLAKNRHGAIKQVIVNWDKVLKKFEVIAQ